MSGNRAYRKLPGRPRCPSCGKKGLGVIRCVVVHGRGKSYRSCRYCGDIIDMEGQTCQRE